jgi:hypothetical protein
LRRKGKQRKGELNALRNMSQPRSDWIARAAQRAARHAEKLKEEKSDGNYPLRGRQSRSKGGQGPSCKHEKEALSGGSVKVSQKRPCSRPLSRRGVTQVIDVESANTSHVTISVDRIALLLSERDT